MRPWGSTRSGCPRVGMHTSSRHRPTGLRTQPVACSRSPGSTKATPPSISATRGVAVSAWRRVSTASDTGTGYRRASDRRWCAGVFPHQPLDLDSIGVRRTAPARRVAEDLLDPATDRRVVDQLELVG